MSALFIALLAVGLLGHAALWVALINVTHASGLSRHAIKGLTLIFLGILCGLPLLVLAILLIEPESPGYVLYLRLRPWLWTYVALCSVVALAHYPRWLWHRLSSQDAGLVKGITSTTVDVSERRGQELVHGFEGRLLRLMPGNQVCRLEVREVTVALPRLPAALDGIVIAHLSDLHFSGRIDIGFFHEVVDQCNAFQADLIALTGDVCDRRECLDWIQPTLGKLEAPLGAFYVLGNHDLRVGNPELVRQALNAAGWINASRGPHHVPVHGQSIMVAGNERPWFPLSEEIQRLPERGAPEYAGEQRAFSVLLAHSPDQLRWGRSHGFDLQLSGHTHGGQIRFPLVGPIFSHSRGGARYASGVSFAPPTLLHVSQGTSSLTPLRLNCPPEITRLVLVRQS